jgi:hypothetical protein
MVSVACFLESERVVIYHISVVDKTFVEILSLQHWEPVLHMLDVATPMPSSFTSTKPETTLEPKICANDSS